jgi:hypothetical protein
MPKVDAHLPENLRVRVKALIEAKGIGMAARLLTSNASTVKCAALGGVIQPGTVALFEKRIAERDKEGKNP